MSARKCASCTALHLHERFPLQNGEISKAIQANSDYSLDDAADAAADNKILIDPSEKSCRIQNVRSLSPFSASRAISSWMLSPETQVFARGRPAAAESPPPTLPPPSRRCCCVMSCCMRHMSSCHVMRKVMSCHFPERTQLAALRNNHRPHGSRVPMPQSRQRRGGSCDGYRGEDPAAPNRCYRTAVEGK